ncbi:MAG: hypothetical protein A3E37_03325 [Candidatus Andersenbacteria bacterium RIFCSPHIGHO2_12_FULL_46_9]|nr:MAG: hypothetical protein UW94_C0003G0028 [Parcubacteria group bacterium GW2011_GWA2_45_14]OGY33815.1 MAG: hypothetical protein A3B76_03050 [Candidatus Andersenbacteria bacterium RIFCSPHIGHO2_02_FULL_46_16]OGY35389.1 MAG: hypothetical protein A3E37_03325 [Candidatus Andersenbacteria bacterium RIFCSPHIGHO2_12_FULL_46_9]OGY36250.1 MAG: hypothetical protein A3I08_05370 [Candidatus Andersenbacteria bacterium RIFCSPLOWO2_02_FULL_46_11]OGY40873.1 MAG: hypothetical protein A3G57_03920 [Candidatus A
MLSDIRVIVREPITRQDMREIVAVEQASHILARSKTEIFKKDNYILLADYRGHVAGYMIFRLYGNRAFLDDIVVLHDKRGKGVGTQMIQRLISLITSVRDGYTEDKSDSRAISNIRYRMASQLCSGIDLYLRETNMLAIYFFSGLGFEARNVLRNFYDKPRDTGEDAYTMHLCLRPHPIQPSILTNRISQYFR